MGSPTLVPSWKERVIAHIANLSEHGSIAKECRQVVSRLGHGIRGEMDVPLIVFMGSAAMVGSFYGARLTGRVRAATLIAVIGLVLVGVGGLLIGTAAFRAA